jgi:hypothetical protein
MPSLSEADRLRVDALLAAVRDIAPAGHPAPVSIGEAGESYRKAFEQYVADLGRARAAGEAWIKGRVDVIVEGTAQSREEALREVLAESPLGPADHASVIGAIRRNWLRCATMNASVRAEQRVPPEQFMLGWLVETNQIDLVTLLVPLPYWPVGLDLREKDQWM